MTANQGLNCDFLVRKSDVPKLGKAHKLPEYRPVKSLMPAQDVKLRIGLAVLESLPQSTSQEPS